MPRALSLLWPDGRVGTRTSRVSDQAIVDLQLPEVIRAILLSDGASTGRMTARERFAHDVLTQLLLDPEVILHRQSLLQDLLEHPTFRQRLQSLLPVLESLGDVRRGERYRPTVDVGLERVARRLADLELLVESIATLTDILQETPVSSPGFRSLRAELADLRAEKEFASLERELPALRATLSSVRSVTIGVNLGPDLMPESATVLDLGTEPVDGHRALLFRLLGRGSSREGLTPLQRGEGGPLGRPNELVRDLRHLLSEVVAPVEAALERFSRISTDSVSHLGAELAFLLGEVQLIQSLSSAGLPMCRPDLLDITDRNASLADMYDVNLALGLGSETLVTNEVRFDARSGRVWVLTGPNRGGKTTYIRGIGLAQVFLQVGMFVPARSAHMSPADAIYTHFPTQEEMKPGSGRLDAEAERLAHIFQTATPQSLILLNEALSGTSALEALDLARGLVRALRLLGARSVYVTHLHELAGNVDEINASTVGDGTVASLSAARSYHIVPGPPGGMSLAAEIAEQHGISFCQLARLLRDRQVV